MVILYMNYKLIPWSQMLNVGSLGNKWFGWKSKTDVGGDNVLNIEPLAVVEREEVRSNGILDLMVLSGKVTPVRSNGRRSS